MKVYLLLRDVPYEFSEVRDILLDEVSARSAAYKMRDTERVRSEEVVIQCWEAGYGESSRYLWAQSLNDDNTWNLNDVPFYCGELVDDGTQEYYELCPVPVDLPKTVERAYQGKPAVFELDQSGEKPCYRRVP